MDKERHVRFMPFSPPLCSDLSSGAMPRQSAASIVAMCGARRAASTSSIMPRMTLYLPTTSSRLPRCTRNVSALWHSSSASYASAGKKVDTSRPCASY
eukprot:scaffold13782_cov26-Tisochrysis_lutea.AAC.3